MYVHIPLVVEVPRNGISNRVTFCLSIFLVQLFVMDAGRIYHSSSSTSKSRPNTAAIDSPLNTVHRIQKSSQRVEQIACSTICIYSASVHMRAFRSSLSMCYMIPASFDAVRYYIVEIFISLSGEINKTDATTSANRDAMLAIENQRNYSRRIMYLGTVLSDLY